MSVDRLRSIMHDSTEHVALVDLARAAIRESRRRTVRRISFIALGVVALLLALLVMWTLLGVTIVSARAGVSTADTPVRLVRSVFSGTGPPSRGSLLDTVTIP